MAGAGAADVDGELARALAVELHGDLAIERPVGLDVTEEGVGGELAEAVPHLVERDGRGAHAALGRGPVEVEGAAAGRGPGGLHQVARAALAVDRQRADVAGAGEDQRLLSEGLGLGEQHGGELRGDHAGARRVAALHLDVERALGRGRGPAQRDQPAASIHLHGQRGARLAGALHAALDPAHHDAVAQRSEELIDHRLLGGPGHAVDLDAPRPLPGVVDGAAEHAPAPAREGDHELGDVVVAERGDEVLLAGDALGGGDRSAIGDEHHHARHGRERDDGDRGAVSAEQAHSSSSVERAPPRLSPRRRRYTAMPTSTAASGM